MSSPPEAVLRSSNIFAVIVDIIMTGAVVAAYLPQIRLLWNSTRNDKPSSEGFSSTYILFHAWLSNVQLSFAIIMLWRRSLQTNLNLFDTRLCIAQMFAQWLCVMAIVVIYVIGRQKEFGGKCVVPLLVIFHTVVFDLVAWDVVRHPHDVSLSVGTGIVEGFLAVFGGLSMPFIMVLQIVAQHFELRKMADYGALSVRSFCMQAIVMTCIAVRLLIKAGITFEPAEEQGEAKRKDTSGFFARIFTALLRWYFANFMASNCLLWVGGAVLVYFSTRSSKTGRRGQDVELGVFLE